MALIDLLEKQGDNLSIPRHGKALVPGCGRVSEVMGGEFDFRAMMFVCLLDTVWTQQGSTFPPLE